MTARTLATSGNHKVSREREFKRKLNAEEMSEVTTESVVTVRICSK